MDDPELEVGERYALDELPENDLNKSGNLEWVGDNLLVLNSDGVVYEFEMAVECTAIKKLNEDGSTDLVEQKEA